MTQKEPKPNKSWEIVAGGAIFGLLTVAALMAFIVVPLGQTRHPGDDAWGVICGALGIRRPPVVPADPVSSLRPLTVSSVVFDPKLLARFDQASVQHGSLIVNQTCSVCHGENGVSTLGTTPSLADQSAYSIYKQLRDFKTGARQNLAMAPTIKSLSERQMLDVAAYLSRNHAFGSLRKRWPTPDPVIQALMKNGDPARNLPACESCHGANAGGPLETPRLYGQQQEYTLVQLQAFARGERRNDVYGRMRTVAQKLTPDEMARLAEAYQGLR